MKIIYVYNEILPRRTAHDVYIFHNVVSLARENNNVTLVCGLGSASNASLEKHYSVKIPRNLKIHRVPIVRKNNILKLSWNKIFFYFAQKYIKKQRPDIVIASVVKQGHYHFSRKLKNTFYVYEDHQLAWYPCDKANKTKQFFQHKKTLQKANLIVVATNAVKQILLADPYSLETPIAVIPLAVNQQSLPPTPFSLPLRIAYIGQLYHGQGVDILLEAIKNTSDIHLDIIGKTHDKFSYPKDKVTFHGFIPPSRLSETLRHVHAFVAPFASTGRMPYTAHTKLYEYAAWQKPIIAPKMDIVEEHLPGMHGVLPFTADDPVSLAAALQHLTKKDVFDALQKDIGKAQYKFSWQSRSDLYQKVLQHYVKQKPK